MGQLTVSGQTAKKLTVTPSKKDNFYPQLSKGRQTVIGSVKSHYFSYPSRTAGSQRIVLTGTTCFHFLKYTHLTIFSTNLRQN